jgi:menaquinol-cytochrome c reductase iron-sulfur subunit
MADVSGAGDKPDVSRRGFLGWAVGLGAAFSAGVVGIPMVASMFGTTPASAHQADFVKVADMANLVTGEVTGLTFVEESVDGYAHELLPHSVWVIKQSETAATVYSPVCPHLGCQVLWNRDSQKFDCPCHGSIFARDGKVLAGPAPRALDTLPSKVVKGELLVEWVYYKLGITEQVPV